jgi:UDP-GlcNAc:undecaprenyl-phosphate GlcNAc-1-phosphate transferase
VACLIGLEIFIELVGILGENRQPVLNILRFIGNSSYRDAVLQDKEFSEEEQDIEETKEVPIQKLSRKDKK